MEQRRKLNRKKKMQHSSKKKGEKWLKNRRKDVQMIEREAHGVPTTRLVRTKCVQPPTTIGNALGVATVGEQLINATSMKALVGTTNVFYDYFLEVSEPWKKYLVVKNEFKVNFMNTSAYPARCAIYFTNLSTFSIATAAEFTRACAGRYGKYIDIGASGSNNACVSLTYSFDPTRFDGTKQYRMQDEYSGTLTGGPANPTTMYYMWVGVLNFGAIAQAANTGVYYSVESIATAKLYNRDDDSQLSLFSRREMEVMKQDSLDLVESECSSRDYNDDVESLKKEIQDLKKRISV
jgi:hypothetical protein